MASAQTMVPLGLGHEEVPFGQHVCYLFHDDDARLDVVARFLQAGRARGEKLLYLLDSMEAPNIVSALHGHGLADGPGPKVEVVEIAEAVDPDRGLDIEAALDVFVDLHRRAAGDADCPGARAVGEMGWCLDRPHCAPLDGVLEFEARLTGVLRQHPCTTCCQYDARRLDGRTILDILHVHPLVIVRGQLLRNPFHVEPDVFLAELRERRS